MEERTLGRTGHDSTVVTFGTASLGRVTQEAADTAVRTILDHGVNHIDIAPSYGEAMERDPQAVARDVRLGYVGRDAAARDYGVVLDAAGAVDAAATKKLRGGGGK